MSKERKKLIEEMRWATERKNISALLKSQLEKIISHQSFDFLTPEESDNFQMESDDWPKDKWKDKLYIQNELTNPEQIEETLIKFLNLSNESFAYIFLLNYNFGLVKIKKSELAKKWKEIIDLDSDEIYCYNCNSTAFICIEKTEEFIVDHEHLGPRWIYELTFSNSKLKRTLETAHNSR